MAFSPPLIFTTTFQIPPPLKLSGDMVTKVQISVTLPFHISSADCRFSMIQLPLPMTIHPLSRR